MTYNMSSRAGKLILSKPEAVSLSFPTMKIAITSGGTKVPLDDIRVLSNISHGTTGALLATYALKAGHTVEYIASKESALPFVGNAAQRLWNGQIQTITD